MRTIKKLARASLRLPVKAFNRLKFTILSRCVSMEKIRNQYERSFLSDADRKHDPVSFLKGFLKDEDRQFISEKIKEKQTIVDYADRIIEHRIDLLGSGIVSIDLGTNSKEPGNIADKFHFCKELQNEIRTKYHMIDWHKDFKSNYRWDPELWYRRIKFGNNPGVDVKVPWELSRFNHMIVLGQAYWLTDDEKYTKEFVYQILDWVESNPVEFGVNWSCTMDVSIRLCNWLIAASFFRDSKYITADFWHFFTKMIYMHGRFIRRNPEKSFMLPATNHYIADLAGLVYAGVFFSGLDIGRSWLNSAVRELKREMSRQVYDDGCDYEASTCYHRLVLELLFFPALLTINSFYPGEDDYEEKCEMIFGRQYTVRLYKMFEAIIYLLKPDGRMPQIGDNDSGRLHVFSPKDVLDMRYLLSIGAVFFNESSFKVKEFGFSGDCLWVFGRHGFNMWHGFKNAGISGIESRSFPDAGWTVLRDDGKYIAVTSGPNGQAGIGGHAHNDKLGFEFFAGGKDLCLDTGTYQYTSSENWRNNFRSTSSHNTIKIDGIEQNRFRKGNIFFLEDNTMARTGDLINDGDFYLLEVQHSGYMHMGNPVLHRRVFKFFKKDPYIEIKDLLTGSGKHLIEVFFNLPGMPGNFIDEDGLEIHLDDWRIRPLESAIRKDIRLDEVQGYYSSEYGIKKPCLRARYYFESALPVEINFIIEKTGAG